MFLNNTRARAADASNAGASRSVRPLGALSLLPCGVALLATLALSGCLAGDTTGASEDLAMKADAIRIEPIGGSTPQVVIYRGPNYTDTSQTLGAGIYEVGELRIGDNTLSSLKVPSGWRVTLYEHASFKGRTKTFTGNGNVGTDFVDITSSIVVQGLRTSDR